MANIDYRLVNKMGFYTQGSQFIKFTFDEKTDEYFIQIGYVRPNGKANERISAAKKLVQAGSVVNQLEKFVKQGYTKVDQPASIVLRSIDDVRNNITTVNTPAVKEEKPQNLSIVPRFELVQGKTAKIAKQVLPIREGSFEHVPSVNKAYFFGEHTNDVILDVIERRPVLLTGHTGCGKTSLVEQIAARINQPMIRSNMNGQTTVGDFVGMWTVKGGETVWVDGVLPRAMKEGHWLVIDEIDCADAAILATLNAVLEKNGVLTLKEKGFEVVKPHENFRLFATANTVGCMAVYRSLYQGTNLMNEAFLDRFRVYHVNYLPEKEEIKVLMATVEKLTPAICQKMVSVANMVRESFRKEEISTTFSTRRLIDWAEMYCRHGNLKKAAETVIYSKIAYEETKIIDGLINRLGA